MNTSKNKKIFGAAGVAALLLLGGLVAKPASADDWGDRKATQNNKNLMRNLGLAAGAAAVYEGIQGKGTNALILGAGAALAGAQYEKDRKDQDHDNRWRDDHRFGYRRDGRFDDHRYDDRRFDRHDDYRYDHHR